MKWWGRTGRSGGARCLHAHPPDLSFATRGGRSGGARCLHAHPPSPPFARGGGLAGGLRGAVLMRSGAQSGWRADGGGPYPALSYPRGCGSSYAVHEQILPALRRLIRGTQFYIRLLPRNDLASL